MMSAAETGIAEGMEKGREAGAIRKPARTAKAMILKRIDLNITAEVTDLPLDIIREVARESGT